MSVRKYNKILPSRNVGISDESDDGELLYATGTEDDEMDEINANFFAYNLTDEEFADSVFLGAGPHEKVRGVYKISDPIPSRPTTANPEYYLTKTFSVYFNPSWNNPKVYIQADTNENFAPTTNISLPTGNIILWSISGQGSGSGSWTYAANTKFRDISSIFTAGGAGIYNVTIRLQGATTAQMNTPLYLAGTASQNAVWVGVPTVDGSGKVSFDMKMTMPEISGIDDWDVEVTEK